LIGGSKILWESFIVNSLVWLIKKTKRAIIRFIFVSFSDAVFSRMGNPSLLIDPFTSNQSERLFAFQVMIEEFHIRDAVIPFGFRFAQFRDFPLYIASDYWLFQSSQSRIVLEFLSEIYCHVFVRCDSISNGVCTIFSRVNPAAIFARRPCPGFA